MADSNETPADIIREEAGACGEKWAGIANFGGAPLPEFVMAHEATLRDYFASAALPACIRVAVNQTDTGAPISEVFARAALYAFIAADAALIARKNEEKQ